MVVCVVFFFFLLNDETKYLFLTPQLCGHMIPFHAPFLRRAAGRGNNLPLLADSYQRGIC